MKMSKKLIYQNLNFNNTKIMKVIKSFELMSLNNNLKMKKINIKKFSSFQEQLKNILKINKLKLRIQNKLCKNKFNKQINSNKKLKIKTNKTNCIKMKQKI